MTNRVKVELDDGVLKQKLAELEQGAAAPKEMLQAIGRSVVTRIRLGFKTGRSPQGARWAPLKWRLGQPLRDKGHLQASVVANPPTADGIEIGTNKVQARLQHFGGEVVPKNGPHLVFKNQLSGGLVFAKKVVLPARPFMPVNDSGQIDIPPAWEAGMLAIVKRHFEGGGKPQAGGA